MSLMKKGFRHLFLLALILMAFSLQAQRFHGGLVAGLTASQIDGDNSNGYNKLGLVAGGRVLVNLSKRFDISLDMQFAQRGSQSQFAKNAYTVNFFSQTFNYVEVPVQLHIRDWYVEDDKGTFSKVSLNLGLSYGRFMNAHYKDDLSALSVVQHYLRKNDYNYLLGASFYANRHLGFTINAVRGIGFVYNPEGLSNPPVKEHWYSHSLYFQAMYMF